MSKTMEAGTATANDNTVENERNREHRLRCRARLPTRLPRIQKEGGRMSKRGDFGTLEIHPDYLEIIEGKVGKTLFLKLRSKNQAGTVLEWICDRDNPPKCITDVTKMSDADIDGRHIVDGMCPYGYRNITNKKSTIFWGRRGTIRMSNGGQL